MKAAVIALTRKGGELALKIGFELKADVYIKDGEHIKYREYVKHSKYAKYREYALSEKEVPPKCVKSAGVSPLVGEIFPLYEGLIFVMACGIVVRSIAPYIKSKTQDPAVVVVDELGRFVISLLSGHWGGANKLAQDVSAITGGIPVITTATDINNVIAFDVFARDNNCAIENIDDLKYVSAELVNGGKVGLYTDCSLRGVLPSNVVRFEAPQVYQKAVVLSNRTDIPVKAEKMLILRPRNLFIGIGCKKGKTKEEVEMAVMNFLKKNGRSILSVRRISSIDLKAKETGIIEFCKDRNIEFATYPAEAIKPLEDKFETSQFVKKVTGVGNVAETCAVLAGKGSRLVCPKVVYNGITLALAEEERSYHI
jgi:cobalt-precorrin 5A hydrolase